MNLLSEILKNEIKAIIEESLLDHKQDMKKELESLLNPPKVNYTVKEVAETLNVTELTVRNYIIKGFIKADKIGRRVLISREELDKALNEVKSLKYRRNG